MGKRHVVTWAGAGCLASSLLMMPVCADETPPVTVRLCVQDQAFYPYILPQGKGDFQRLTTQALKALPIKLDMAELPWPRCLRRVQDGQSDGAIGGWLQERTAYAVYPMKNGALDTQRAIGTIRFAVYRRKGEPASWDGRRFELPAGATIGVQRSFSFVDALKARGVPVDSHSTSAAQLIDKLVHGRNALVIVQKEYGDLVLQDPKLAGLIEQLPQEYVDIDIYILFTKSFQAAHPQLVEQIWNAVRQGRAS